MEKLPVFLNRLTVQPASNSRAMRAYMAAILETTGMMSGEGFRLRKFMENFATHLSPKEGFPHATLRIGDDGLVRVTAEGFHFFSSRLTGSPIIKGQHVTRVEVIEMIRCIVAPTAPDGWEPICIS